MTTPATQPPLLPFHASGQVPEATAATNDLVCWLWAAFAPRDGSLNITRVAQGLGVSRATVRRWIRSNNPKLTRAQVARLHQRAILRGRGHYLWPALDETSRARSELLHQAAIRNDELIRNEPERVAPTWQKDLTLDSHEVHIVHYPKAHVYGVAVSNHPKTLPKLRRFGEILQTVTVPNKYAAIALKHEVLERMAQHRCIVPSRLVPSGRTEVWREAAGPGSLRPPLRVAIIQPAPGKSQLPTMLTQTIPNLDVDEHVVRTADELAAALATQAHIAIVTGIGYTRASWQKSHKSERWPGGRWRLGGGGTRAATIGLPELTASLQHASPAAPVLIVAAGFAVRARAAFRAHAGQTLLLKDSRMGVPATREILAMVTALEATNDRDAIPAVQLERFQVT